MIFKNKRAQGLSIRTIIIAVLALIVLVVLTAIFIGKIEFFSDKTDEAGDTSVLGVGTLEQGDECVYKKGEGKDEGTCQPKDECENRKDQPLIGEKKCKSGLVCCA